MTARNLVIFHLESVSNAILWQYRVEMDAIWELMQMSQVYSNFHANATSTRMAVMTLTRGHTEINDHLPHYGMAAKNPGVMNTTLWWYLRDAGYCPYTIIHDRLFHRRGSGDLWIKVNDFESCINSFQAEIDAAASKKRPFAIWIRDYTSHMAANTPFKLSASSLSERFRNAYRGINATMKSILDVLRIKNLLDNTVVVVYGDHGDELWCHDVNRGFCHGTPPYSSLTWTPLFIYESGQKPSVVNDLIAMSDLRNLVLRRLVPDYAPPPQRAFHEDSFGVNQETKKRELAFSQNLYALQMEYDDPERALTKGYAVTDGEYRVVVTSGGNTTRDGGMEFYCERLDPFNSRNLLDYFQLDGNGEPTGLMPPAETSSPDFPAAFNRHAVEALKKRYCFLRRELHAFVRAKESLAMRRKASVEYHVMPERVFRHSRKRLRRN